MMSGYGLSIGKKAHHVSLKWSSPHEIPSVMGVGVKLRELSSGKEYVTYPDRLSNSLSFG